jgi:hypothetical protein
LIETTIFGPIQLLKFWRGYGRRLSLTVRSQLKTAPRLSDGAAGAVLMDLELAKERGLAPLFKIISWASVGVDPSIMGVGPITAAARKLQVAAESLPNY